MKALLGILVGFSAILTIGLSLTDTDTPTPDSDSIPVCTVTSGGDTLAYAVPLPGTYVVTQLFGGISPVTGTHHNGFDMAVPDGTTVLSAASGTVTAVSDQGRASLGKSIVVTPDTPSSLRFVYGHLSAATVRVGDRVEAGQPIALTGHSGIATGPHLHFEIRDNGTPIDPVALFAQMGIDLVSEADHPQHAGASCTTAA